MDGNVTGFRMLKAQDVDSLGELKRAILFPRFLSHIHTQDDSNDRPQSHLKGNNNLPFSHPFLLLILRSTLLTTYGERKKEETG